VFFFRFPLRREDFGTLVLALRATSIIEMDRFRPSPTPLLLSVLLLGVALVGSACNSGGSSSGLEIRNPGLFQGDRGQRFFTGTLVNERSSPISIAQIEVALYDDTGSPVETVRIEVENITPGDSVDFSHRIDSDRSFSQAQVRSILTP